MAKYSVSFVIEGTMLADDVELYDDTIESGILAGLSEEGGSYWGNRDVDTKIRELKIKEIEERDTGFECPECGSDESFTLTGEGIITVTKSRTEPEKVEVLKGYGWEAIGCNECGVIGEIKEFRKEE